MIRTEINESGKLERCTLTLIEHAECVIKQLNEGKDEFYFIEVNEQTRKEKLLSFVKTKRKTKMLSFA